jgi:hypothetical protein
MMSANCHLEEMGTRGRRWAPPSSLRFRYDPFRGRVSFFAHRRLHLRLSMLLSSGQPEFENTP